MQTTDFFDLSDSVEEMKMNIRKCNILIHDKSPNIYPNEVRGIKVTNEMKYLGIKITNKR